jgi:hypothetical protein
MIPIDELKKISTRIKSLRDTAEELQSMAANIPAVTKNTARLLASVKMLEMNISDCVDPDILD